MRRADETAAADPEQSRVADTGLKAMIPFRRELTGSRVVASFAAGLTVTIVSFWIHRAMAAPVPAIDPETAQRFFRTFVTFWDWHRSPVPLRDKGVTLAIEAAVLAVAALAWSGRNRPVPGRLLLRMVAIGGFASLGLALWSRAPSGWMPDWLVALMPGRMLNISIMVLPALLFGLISASRPPLLARVWVVLLAAGLLSARGSLLWTVAGVPPPISFGANSVLAFGTLGALLVGAMTWRWPDRRPADYRSLHAALISVFILAAVVAIVDASRGIRWRMEARSPWKRDAALSAAAHGSGPLLTGGDLFMIQLRTRRPVVLDGGALDVLPYAVESGPEMDRVLRGVYGIDLFNPPAEARGGGRVPSGANRQVWTAFSRDRWRQLAREYRFKQVLTPSGWTLALPLVASSPDFVLYAIAD